MLHTGKGGMTVRLKTLMMGTLGALAAVSGIQTAGAIEQGDWLVRGRIAAVVPQDDSGAVFVFLGPACSPTRLVDFRDLFELFFRNRSHAIAFRQTGPWR